MTQYQFLSLLFLKFSSRCYH